MNLPIIEKIQEHARKAEDATKERMERTRDQIKEIQNKGQELVSKSNETIRQRATRSRKNITRAEAQALDTIGAWLDRLNEVTGEKAEFIDKGRQFIDQVSRDVRMGNLTMEDLPIGDYDSLGVKKIAAALKELPPDQREMVRVYEQAHKNRVSVGRAIDRLAKAEAQA